MGQLSPRHAIRQARWHPLSETSSHLAVLTNDGRVSTPRYVRVQGAARRPRLADAHVMRLTTRVLCACVRVCVCIRGAMPRLYDVIARPAQAEQEHTLVYSPPAPRTPAQRKAGTVGRPPYSAPPL